MPDKTQLLYWDSCVFLSYIDAEVGRVDVLDTILTEVKQSKGAKKIVTSTVSIVEVAYGSREKLKVALDPTIEQKIDALWNDSSVLTFIEFHDGIARIARNFIRDAVSRGLQLSPLDAVHLASAQWSQVYELQSYDKKLHKFSSLIGRTICDPYALQTRIPGT